MAKSMEVPVLIFEDSDEAEMLIDALHSFLEWENNLSDDEYKVQGQGQLKKHKARVKMAKMLDGQLNKILNNILRLIIVLVIK